MKLLIIEDERCNADRLCRLLAENIDIDTEVVGIARSNAEALRMFADGIQPDVILSDIQLGDGLSFESLQSAPAHVPVIFTTAFDQYAVQAFRYNGIAYLLKPIDPEELATALQQVAERQNEQRSHNHPSDTDQLREMLASLSGRDICYRERFLIAFRDEWQVVPVCEVSHIGLVEGSLYLYTNKGKQHLLNQTLEELEQQLDPKRFMRINRQYIVHINAVQSLVAHFLGKMQLRLRNYPDTQILVSRAKVPHVKQWLDS